MNNLQIERLIVEHFSQWEHFNQKTTARANQNFVPPKDDWCRITIQGGINQMGCINDTPCTKENGLLIVQLFTLENTGTAKIKAKADSLAKHLAYYQSEKLELLTASIINVGTSNGYYQVNVSIPYRYY